jgi:plastocyanin
MHNETLFYIFGIGLAVSAVVVSFLGLKVKGFPGKAFPVVVIWFAIFVGGAATFAVLHAKDEEKEKAAETEPAGEKYEEESKDVEAEEAAEEEDEAASEKGKGEKSGDQAESKAAPGGATTTLTLVADTSALAFDKKSLTAKAGKVLLTFDNPSPIPHDVAIDQDGKEIAVTPEITESSASLSADLKPGDYTFLCTVPGHAEAGMEGTLTVR